MLAASTIGILNGRVVAKLERVVGDLLYSTDSHVQDSQPYLWHMLCCSEINSNPTLIQHTSTTVRVRRVSGSQGLASVSVCLIYI